MEMQLMGAEDVEQKNSRWGKAKTSPLLSFANTFIFAFKKAHNTALKKEQNMFG